MRVVSGKVAGSRFATVANNSLVLDKAGKGRQRVRGSDRPGKVSSRILTMASMA